MQVKGKCWKNGIVKLRTYCKGEFVCGCGGGFFKSVRIRGKVVGCDVVKERDQGPVEFELSFETL